MATTYSRIRSQYTRTSINLNTGAVTTGAGPMVNHDSYTTKTNAKRPGWRKAIARQSQAGTNHLVDAESNIPIFGIINYDYTSTLGTNFRARVTGDLSGGATPRPGLPPDMSALDIEARIGFTKKARRMMGGFQSGVFLGELRETIRTITRPGEGIRRAIDSYYWDVKKRTRGVRGTKAVNRAMAGSWLQAQFAIKPLVSDVDNIMQTLAGRAIIYGDPISYTARSASMSERIKTQISYSGVNVLDFVFDKREVYNGLVKYKGLVAWESKNMADTWQNNWGISLRQFVPSVYELIPYSWLVDYFSNMGEIVNGLCLGDIALRWGIRIHRGQTSVELWSPRVVRTGTPVNKISMSVSAKLPHISKFSYHRTLVTSVGIGLSDFQTTLPGSWMKWANIGALANMRVLR